MKLSKEQQLFKQTMLQYDDYTEEHFELDKFGNFSWIGTSDHFDIWELCAKAKQAEIDAKEELIKNAINKLQWLNWKSLDVMKPKIIKMLEQSK